MILYRAKELVVMVHFSKIVLKRKDIAPNILNERMCPQNLKLPCRVAAWDFISAVLNLHPILNS